MCSTALTDRGQGHGQESIAAKGRQLFRKTVRERAEAHRVDKTGGWCRAIVRPEQRRKKAGLGRTPQIGAQSRHWRESERHEEGLVEAVP